MNEQPKNDKPLIDQHVLDLLNGSIDGELDKTEQAELDRLMVDSEHVRNLYGELRAISNQLDQVPEREPPGYLQGAIERQVRLPVAESHSSSNRGVGRWLQANWLRTGFALAAGVVLTFGVYEMGSEPISLQDSENLVGTVVKKPVAIQGELLGTILLETDALNGVAQLRNSDDLFVLDLQLNSAGPSEVAVNFDRRGLVFEDMTPGQGEDGAVSATDGSVTVAGNGEQHFTMRFRRMSESVEMRPLELEFFNNNKLVHEAELSVSGN